MLCVACASMNTLIVEDSVHICAEELACIFLTLKCLCCILGKNLSQNHNLLTCFCEFDANQFLK